MSGPFSIDKIIHGILEPVSMFNQKKRRIIPSGDLNNFITGAVRESQYIRKDKCSPQWFFGSFYTIDLPEESTTNYTYLHRFFFSSGWITLSSSESNDLN